MSLQGGPNVDQVSSDHHQMSLSEGPGLKWGVITFDVQVGTLPDLSRGWRYLSCGLSHDAFDVTPLPEQTGTCVNITFPQTYLQALDSQKSAHFNRYSL